MASEKPRSLRRKAPQRLEPRTPNRAATKNDPQQHPARQLFEVSKRKDQTTRGFNTPEWHELRLDIDPSVGPDVVGTMTDMAEVISESVDAIFSSHNLEHLEAHEVPVALQEFRRVLKPDGHLE